MKRCAQDEVLQRLQAAAVIQATYKRGVTGGSKLLSEEAPASSQYCLAAGSKV